jgi:hypothetical protein
LDIIYSLEERWLNRLLKNYLKKRLVDLH